MQKFFQQTRWAPGLALCLALAGAGLGSVLVCSAQHEPEPIALLQPNDQALILPEETHFKNIRQLTTGHSALAASGLPAADFAEAYWSPDGKSLILQSTSDGLECDQIFTYDLITGARQLVSTGQGRATCSYFCADGTSFIYSSTHGSTVACPQKPDMSQGYVWKLDPDFEIYLADLASGEVLQNITNSPGYDAEGTIDWVNGWLYFTSTRDTDLEIYRQHLETGEVERLTNEFGYDGGPFINYDGTKVVYRRAFFDSEGEKQDYRDLLAQGLIRPTKLELMVMDCDGSNKRQLTNNGAANFAPYLHPDGETIIFASNLHNPAGFDFDLYTININGGEPERITFDPAFDGFPMFSPDGSKLAWCSNRNGSQARETNLFVVDWVQ